MKDIGSLMAAIALCAGLGLGVGALLVAVLALLDRSERRS